MGKLQPGQTFPLGKLGETGQGNPAARSEEISLPVHPIKARGFDEKPLHPLIRYQQIGTVPQEKGGDVQLMGGRHRR